MNHKQIIYKTVKDTQNEILNIYHKKIFFKKPHKKIFKKIFLKGLLIKSKFLLYLSTFKIIDII